MKKGRSFHLPLLLQLFSYYFHFPLLCALWLQILHKQWEGGEWEEVERLPASSSTQWSSFLLNWITVSPSPAASLRQDPSLIHLHTTRPFSWPWRGAHLLLAFSTATCNLHKCCGLLLAFLTRSQHSHSVTAGLVHLSLLCLRCDGQQTHAHHIHGNPFTLLFRALLHF